MYWSIAVCKALCCIFGLNLSFSYIVFTFLWFNSHLFGRGSNHYIKSSFSVKQSQMPIDWRKSFQEWSRASKSTEKTSIYCLLQNQPCFVIWVNCIISLLAVHHKSSHYVSATSPGPQMAISAAWFLLFHSCTVNLTCPVHYHYST